MPRLDGDRRERQRRERRGKRRQRHMPDDAAVVTDRHQRQVEVAVVAQLVHQSGLGARFAPVCKGGVQNGGDGTGVDGALGPQAGHACVRSISAIAAAGLAALWPEMTNRNTSRAPDLAGAAIPGRSSGCCPPASARARSAQVSSAAGV